MTGELPFNRDFADIVAELTSANAEFVIVGGFAVAAHGHQRATKDLDVFVNPTAENATRVLSALVAFGAPLHGVTAEDVAAPGLILQLGIPPRRIDVINAIEGVSFSEASMSILTVHVGGVAVPVIGLDALLKNKSTVGRPEDLKDVRVLKRLHGRTE